MSTEVNVLDVQPKKNWPPSLQALVAPGVGMERQARVGSVWLPLCLAMVCSLSAGIIAARRVDARAATLRMLDTTGQLAGQSDRQIEDAQKSAERSFVVQRIAVAVFAPGVWMCLFAVEVIGLGWFARGRTKLKSVFPVAAAALLPFAIADLLETGALLQHSSISSEPEPLVTSTLSQIAAALGHPLAGNLGKLLASVELFSLWSAVLVAFGVASAAGVPTRRALFCTLVAWLAFRLLRTVVIGG